MKRFWSLLPEIKQFLVMKHRDIALLEKYEWFNDLAFLIDMTQMLSDLNLKFQGKDQLVHKMLEHVESFMAKLLVIKNQLLSKKTTHLSTLSERDSESSDHTKYCGLLEKLKGEFENKCQDFKKAKIDLAMFSDPFTVNAETAQEEFQFELLDLQSNRELKTAHRENSLLDFYRKYLSLGNYPALCKHAMVYFSLFGSTYRCEQFFSQMKNVKTDRRSKLTDKHLADTLRVATSTIEVDIDSIDIKTNSNFTLKYS